MIRITRLIPCPDTTLIRRTVVKLKYLAVAAMVLVFAGSAFAQEGETTVVDEVVAQVNDDVITLSMLKKETQERIEALKQNGMTEQQARDEGHTEPTGGSEQ